MNLIEAIKSGRPFRRKVWTAFNRDLWCGVVIGPDGLERVVFTKGWTGSPTFEAHTGDILADDWEILVEDKQEKDLGPISRAILADLQRAADAYYKVMNDLADQLSRAFGAK